MTRLLGAASSIPDPPEHRDEQRRSRPQRGGEAAPNDHIHEWVESCPPSGQTGEWVVCLGCGFQKQEPDHEHLRRLDYWAEFQRLVELKKRLEAK